MSLDPSDPAPKRRSHIARWLLSFTILAICGVLLLGQKHDKLILTCNGIRATPQEALDACDFLLTWTAKEPSTRSLLHRHKLRAHMRTQNFDDALIEADLAIAEDPESYVPWMWRSTVLARSNRNTEAMEAIEKAISLEPGKHLGWHLAAKTELLRRLDRFDEARQLANEAIQTKGAGAWAWNNVGKFDFEDQDYASSSVSFSNALREEPHNRYARRMFFRSCDLADGECPVLYAEDAGDTADIGCDEAMIAALPLFPIWQLNADTSAGPEKLLEFLAGRSTLQSGLFARYAKGMERVVDGKTGEDVESFAVVARVFQCVQDARQEIEPDWLEKQTQNAFDRAYPARTKENALLWAKKVYLPDPSKQG